MGTVDAQARKRGVTVDASQTGYCVNTQSPIPLFPAQGHWSGTPQAGLGDSLESSDAKLATVHKTQIVKS